MTRVGFIGLGIMGRPMAANLVKAGFEVTGTSRGSESLDALEAAGGHRSASVAEAVAKADVVITMLPDSPDVESVALGDDGILANAAPGAFYIDMSSIRPDVARRLAEQGGALGLRVLDAPVSGGQQGAIDGSLSIMVGAAPEDFKAANQLIVAGTIELVAEAIVFLRAYGVDTEAAVRVLAGGLAGNAILERKAAGMLAGSFEPGFRIDLHHKDLGIVQAAAREAGVVIPLGAVVAQLMASMRAQGHGGLDHTALLLLVEQLSSLDAG